MHSIIATAADMYKLKNHMSNHYKDSRARAIGYIWGKSWYDFVAIIDQYNVQHLLERRVP